MSVGSADLSHKVVLAAWILSSLQSNLLCFCHIASIGSYGVGRELGMTRHQRSYSFALLGWHTQRGIARKGHGAMIIIIAVGPYRVLHAIVQRAHKRHNIYFVAEPHLLQELVATAIIAQPVGKVFINILVAGIDNNLSKEHTVGTFKL